MLPLHDARRRKLLNVSALLCAIPVLLAPIAGRSSFELASEEAAFNQRFAPPAPSVDPAARPMPVSRDPFVPDRLITLPAPAAFSSSPNSESVVGMQVTQGESTGIALPSNRGALGTPVTDSSLALPSVRAIVTGGGSAHALVDDGAHVSVVGVGDKLDGSKITSIDATGVRLANGMLLTLAEVLP